MKRNDFLEIKNMDKKALLEKAKKIKQEISELVMDKNMNKMKDLKMISKKRKNLAQILTVLRQKELLESFEKGATK